MNALVQELKDCMRTMEGMMIQRGIPGIHMRAKKNKAMDQRNASEKVKYEMT